MSLRSKLFRGDTKLEAAAVSDPAHVLTGASGLHVAKIQKALIQLDGATIARGEMKTSRYGTTTAAAVLAYKKKRKIINHSYQAHADDIVGKMTMAALDDEMARAELLPEDPQPFCQCGNHFARRSGAGRTAAVRFGLRPVSARNLAQVGQSSAKSPKAEALSRVDAAKEWITKTLEALDRANISRPPTPLKEWQGLNANFALPHGFSRVTKVPGTPFLQILGNGQINTKEEYIDQLINIFRAMRRTLASANTLVNETFLTKPGVVGPKTYAITLTRTNNFLDPSLPDGMYFTPFYTTAGKNKQIEVLIHECAHFIANTIIQDMEHPDEPKYLSLSPGEALHNAYSYSTLAIHSVFGFTGTFDHLGNP